MRTILIASVIGCLVIAGAATAFFIDHANQDATKKQVADLEQSKYVSGGVNYSPPTDAEKTAAADQKQKNQEREQLDQQVAASTADISISDANQYDNTVEVRAYMSNIYETGGKCTATFTKSGSATVTTTSQAFTDAKSVQCGALDTPRSKFASSGNWSLVVSYSSNQASGTSSATTVEIK